MSGTPENKRPGIARYGHPSFEAAGIELIGSPEAGPGIRKPFDLGPVPHQCEQMGNCDAAMPHWEAQVLRTVPPRCLLVPSRSPSLQARGKMSTNPRRTSPGAVLDACSALLT